MSPDILQTFVNKILSETGLVGGLLFLACVYLGRQWSKERDDHKKTIERLWTISEKSITSSTSSSEAIANMRAVVERLLAARGGNGQ